MKRFVPITLAFFGVLFWLSISGVAAQEAAKPEPVEVRIGFIRAYERQLALSILDVLPQNDGIAGAELAIADNNTTGKFLGQDFALDVKDIKPGDDAVPAFQELLASGTNFILADLSAEQLLSIADTARDNGVLIFNVGATDDMLREEECRVNVFHVAPARTMLADGLAQYLIWKQWRRWVLIYGSHERDQLFAEALRRAATRFGGEIVAQKEFKDTGTARRTDTGVIQIQRQMPVFTQDLPEHDVLLVADESEVFGTYVPFRTWIARPVAGTAGLIPSSWHPAHEQWAGMQIQNRFEKAFGRRMLAKDIQAWTAVRIVGEAATRTNSNDRAKIEAYVRSDGFLDCCLQGAETDLPQVELATPSTHHSRRWPLGSDDLTAGRFFAPGVRTGHAGRRPAGDEVHTKISS